MIEGALDVCIQDILGLLADLLEDRLNRVVAAPSWAKAVAVNPKQRSHPLYSASKPCVLIAPHTAPQ
jgi:hypothetical protein